jgi:glycerol-3-phosphate O-acyltransferase/dihydroxyacetone phosphate acyltransferase
MSSLIYTGLQFLLKQVTGNYFRNIEVTGLENMPKEGPTILCCNHSNQFIDAMLLIAQCPRPLSFCFAASSFNKPVIGYFAKKIDVIPVYRADDSKITGKGKIIMTSETEIQGFDTKFISEVKNNNNFKLGIHSLLIQKKYKLIVEKVVDEEHMIIRSDSKTYEILKKQGKQNYSLIPKLDNSLMFKETCQKLKENKAICIFPEGTSHDRTHLLQLKPGVAYFALEAMANYGVKNIKLISCGFSYYSRDVFRSDLVLEFGQPHEIQEQLAKTFKENKKHAIEIVMKIVETQMKSVILTAPTYNEYMFLKMLRNLYVPEEEKLSAEKSYDLARRLAIIYNCVRDNKNAIQIKAQVMKYMDPLEKLGLEDEDLKEINVKYQILIKKFISSFLLFIIDLIIALPMFLLLFPLIIGVRKKAETERNKALAKNHNKVEARDVVSSVKVITFVSFLPIFGLIWINICYIFANYFLSNRQLNFINIFIFGCISFMFYGYISINIFDKLKLHFDTLKTLFYYFIVPKGFDNLKNMRKKLVEDVKDFLIESAKNTPYENNNEVLKPWRQRTLSLEIK